MLNTLSEETSDGEGENYTMGSYVIVKYDDKPNHKDPRKINLSQLHGSERQEECLCLAYKTWLQSLHKAEHC